MSEEKKIYPKRSKTKHQKNENDNDAPKQTGTTDHVCVKCHRIFKRKKCERQTVT